MPLYDVKCQKCFKLTSNMLVKSREDVANAKCASCGSSELELLPSFPSNYQIRGDNSASTRPKKRRSK